MKIIWKFDSNDESDIEDIRVFNNARNNLAVLERAQQHIRSLLKYDDDISEEVALALERVREILSGAED
jgi:hypothetical protein